MCTSLYNEDDGVVLFDSIEDAEEAKARWEQTVPVEGPFEHDHIERLLIPAAQNAAALLLRLRSELTDPDIQREMERATERLRTALGVSAPGIAATE